MRNRPAGAARAGASPLSVAVARIVIVGGGIGGLCAALAVGQAGHERACQHFSIELTARRMETVYRELIG